MDKKSGSRMDKDVRRVDVGPAADRQSVQAILRPGIDCTVYKNGRKILRLFNWQVSKIAKLMQNSGWRRDGNQLRCTRCGSLMNQVNFSEGVIEDEKRAGTNRIALVECPGCKFYTYLTNLPDPRIEKMRERFTDDPEDG